MPGVLATNELVVIVDDPTCCRVYAGRPIAVGDATLLNSSQLRMKCTDSGLTWASGTPEHQDWRWIWKATTQFRAYLW